MCPHQVLSATLTLSQPRGADYAHPTYTGDHTPQSTPSFKSHRRACCTDIDLFSYQMLISLSTVLAFLLGKKQNEEYLVAFLG